MPHGEIFRSNRARHLPPAKRTRAWVEQRREHEFSRTTSEAYPGSGNSE